MPALQAEKSGGSTVVYLEALRIFSVFWVIFNHTGSKGFFLLAARPEGSLLFWCDMAIAMFSKLAVPVFMGISGAVLLGRKSETPRKYFTRLIRAFTVYFCISAFYFIDTLLVSGEKLSFGQALFMFFKSVYSASAKGHLWFMPFYLYYLICLPFLRPLAQSMSDKAYRYLIALAVIFIGFKPVFEFVVRQNTHIISGFLSSTFPKLIIIYPLVGYYMHARLSIESVKKILFPLWIADIAGIALSCFITYSMIKVTGVLSESDSQLFFNCFALLSFMAVFISMRCIFEGKQIPDKIKQIICTAGKCTFGIYLIHFWFVDRVMETVYSALTGLGLGKMIAAWLFTLLIMLISGIAVFIFKLITNKLKSFINPSAA